MESKKDHTSQTLAELNEKKYEAAAYPLQPHVLNLFQTQMRSIPPHSEDDPMYDETKTFLDLQIQQGSSSKPIICRLHKIN